jgi:hypothetical protein
MVSVSRTLFQNAEQRGHWPLSRYAVDGYNSVGLDVPTHFAFGNIHTAITPGPQPNRWLFLVGAATAGSDAPRAQARAWLHPADVEVLDGATVFRGYDAAERAYRFAPGAGKRRVSVRFAAAGGVFHPVLLLDTPVAPPTVQINGAALPAEKVAVGRTAAGATVIFLNVVLPDDATVSFDLP